MFPVTLISSDLFPPNKIKTEEFKSIQNAKKTSLNSKQEVNSDPKTYISSFQKFVKEADSKIDTNKKKFSELKALLQERCQGNSECLNKIVELENNNSKLKAELDNYVLQGGGNWELFRKSLFQDLNKLDLAYNNAKF